MSSLGPHSLWLLIEDGQAPVILDVRSAAEYRRGHVPGARHVPFWRAFRETRQLPPAGEHVVLYCGHGPRAWIAAWQLRRRGWRRPRFLRGHMAGWRRAGLPEETGGATDRSSRPDD